MTELQTHIVEPLWDDEFVLSRRASGDRLSSHLVITPASPQPTVEAVTRLAHAYALRDELDPAWAARPVALEHRDGKPALLMEDPGGEVLARLIGKPWDLTLFLQVASALAVALGRLHSRGFIHKDVKPSNILVNSDTREVWLLGFGIATRLSRERRAPAPPEMITGTLAYMAPEQTGCMNRSIDARSDLYSLGVLLYEMVTGALPFTASDPMEWIHCHIARKPVQPTYRLKTIPAQVSRIVVKLLAKTAEERYQTAAGVENDLRRCLAEWELTGRIAPFVLGEHDIPDRLLIPEKLYGRAREVETLLASFERIVRNGRPELVVVSGYSGIGKSAVVNELHKSLVPSRGLFASGKFDQYKRDIPYSTLAQAFQTLVRGLLAKSEIDLAPWRDAVREALGANGRLMTDLVPELALIIGQQASVPELPPQDARRRFQQVFRRFIGVFARSEHPLALFLDDLQWLDAATLDLIEDLLTHSDVSHLMLIGAYRDNEVGPTHPLVRKLQSMRQAGALLQDIVLAPLTIADLKQLVADALHCGPGHAGPLAALVLEKTTGNPFFSIQFISALCEESLLVFDHVGGRWSWDLNGIHAKGYTDNVVDLMVRKLTRLGPETQHALKQLACLGNSAEFEMLRVLYPESMEQVHAQLAEAVGAGLISRSENAYHFLHDRVQEAAYSLIPEELRAETHLRIGRLMASHIAPDKLDEGIFEIVNQLNRGLRLVASSIDRVRIAELNLIAGRRAKTSSAYVSALKYLHFGRGLLTDDIWDQNYPLLFSIELLLAECELLTTEMAAAESRLSMLTRRARDAHRVALVTRLRLTLYTTLDRSDRAVEVFLEYLRGRGTDWSPHPTEEDVLREYECIWSLLGKREIEELVDLPLMTDPEVLDVLDVFTEIVDPALFTDSRFLALVICRMASLSLEHGNSDASCFAYVWLGMLAGSHFKNYPAGFRFGKLGYDLVEKRGLHRYQARTYISFAALIIPWTRHVDAAQELYRRGFDAANRIGDLTYAAHSFNGSYTISLAKGDPLAEVQREAETGLNFATNLGFVLAVDCTTAQLGLIRTLRGLTASFGEFNHDGFEELRFERHLASDPVLALPECWYWIRKLQARFFAGDYPAAIEASSKAERLLWTSPAFFEAAEHNFYSALAHAASLASATGPSRQRHLAALVAHHKQHEMWARHCPENFENRAALVGAEAARIEGRVLEAELLYEKAILSARNNGFVHHEAIAYELAARFYASRGFQKFADAYLLEARYCYQRWGADGKIRQLDQLYPHLREKEPARGPTSTIGTSVEQLDLATVIKVSQAVWGENALEQLIDTLLRTAIEHACAERGLLLLSRGGELRIAAEAATCGDTVSVSPRNASVSGTALPESIVHYVARTQETVILDDASVDSSVGADPYIRQHRLRSILCLPLIHQSKLIGVLYLENNLAPGVFTPTRISVLKLLALQAAISLENTRLYGDLKQREAKIRRLIDANVMGVIFWNLDGVILDANDAFLHMLGYSREEFLSGRMCWPDLTPVEWRAGDRRTVADIRVMGTVRPFEKEYIRKDGSRVPVLIGAALFEQGGAEGVAFVLDLSERKLAENALRQTQDNLAESEERYRTLAETAMDVILTIDRTGAILFVNQAVKKTFGHAPAELVGQSITVLMPERMRRLHEEAMRRYMDTGEKRLSWSAVSLPGLHKDGRELDLDVSFAEIATGDKRFFSGILRDVTQRKRTEEALRQTQVELAHVTRVATLGEMSASIAHEVNQPLAGVINSATACLRWLDAQRLEEARRSASRIIAEGHRATEIISRIRALARKAPPQKDWLSVNETIHEVVALARSEMQRHGVALQMQLSDTAPMVRADRIQLQQVLLNLMMNAMEAMTAVEKNARELLVCSSTEDSKHVVISVHDSGPGIDPANLNQLFNAFYTTKPQGLGMGLAISRSLVEAHGGRLWAAADAPRGAVFQFMLPVDSEEQARRDAAPSEARAPQLDHAPPSA